MSSIRCTGLLAAALLAAPAWADDDATCAAGPSRLPVERRLRQLTLDLLGRPPTVSEYRFFQAKGDVLREDVEAMLERDEFYTRMGTYHRALLRANIGASIDPNPDLGISPIAGVEGMRGNPASPLRGQQGTHCDVNINQDDCNAVREDPHLEPAVKRCRDAAGVPLPVSVDYNNDTVWQCAAISGATSCTQAVSAGLLPARLLLFCDMRRPNATAAPMPNLCRPRPQTVPLDVEETNADGLVVAYRTAAAPTPGAPARLEACTLNLALDRGVQGRWRPQLGCIQKEGYVENVTPFWTSTPTRVCAIQAQTRSVNPWTLESCETGRFSSDRSCGCGEGLRRCEGAGLHSARVAAFNEEPLRIVDSVLRRNEDYFSVLTTRRSFVNGSLSQLYRNTQSPTLWLATAPAPREAIPDVPLAARGTWVEYTRHEAHAGVLTTASYLYRFPTQRARVSHFWEAFLCKHFTSPAGVAPPPPEDGCHRENNLARRCACSSCHATIEPTGAHWGRFGERNAQFLDPELFPRLDARCRDCALAGDVGCNGECTNYVMQAFDGEGAKSLGLLRTYLYRTPEEEPNVAGGPRLLVERTQATGDLESCTVKNLWRELLGRAMTTEEQRLYLTPLMQAFAAENHNLKALVREIVSTDAYRRVD